MRELTIRGVRIADDTPAYVVAEIGSNHQGDLSKALDLVEAAAAAGANAVKFQKRDNRSLYTKAFYNQPYHSEHAFGATYGLHRQALELNWQQLRTLAEAAHKLGLAIGCTAFDVPSAHGLLQLADEGRMDFLKVASGDLTNLPLIRQLASSGVKGHASSGMPLIISTGGGTMEDVVGAWCAAMRGRGWEPLSETHFALLQCTAAYPCQPAEMNLRVIETYRERLKCVVGLSDHHDGISLAPVAYALGARIFEKHFTLSHTWKGSDQAFSLEPEGLRRMVKALRDTHEALGDGVKRVHDSEREPIRKMSKSVVAARDLPAGHVLTDVDLSCKSPGGGLPPFAIPDLVHQRLVRAAQEDEPITREMVQPWD